MPATPTASAQIGWIDFRDPPDRWQAEATERGGVMSVNHPWAWDCAWRMPLARPADLVEMWHWTWDRRDTGALTDWPSFGQRAIGGSDFHRPGPTSHPASPTTWLECADRSVEAVLEALRTGRVAISASPDGPVVLRDGDEFVHDRRRRLRARHRRRIRLARRRRLGSRLLPLTQRGVGVMEGEREDEQILIRTDSRFRHAR